MSGRSRPLPPKPPTSPHPPAEGRPRLSVVVPAYREERRIEATVVALVETLAGPLGRGGLEIVVVDDGSGDATAGRASGAGADRVVVLPLNRGKGAAVRAGVLACTGSTVVFTDADLSYPPSQVLRLLEQVELGWDVVVGSRTHTETRTLIASSRVRELTGRVFNRVTAVVLDRRFGDTQCGLKAFHRDAATEIFGRSRIDGFAFDVELLWLAGHLGCSIEEVPVELASAEGSTVRLNVDPIRMVRDLWRIRRGAARSSYGPGAGAE